MGTRHFPNPFRAAGEGVGVGATETHPPKIDVGPLTAPEALAITCKKEAFSAVQDLSKNYLRGYGTDPSVYTGIGGIILVQLCMAETFGGDELGASSELLRRLVEKMKNMRSSKSGKRVSFLNGRIGTIALDMRVNGHLTSQDMEGIKSEVDAGLSDPEVPDELLFGKAGLLWGLLWIISHCFPRSGVSETSKIIEKRNKMRNWIHLVATSIIESGLRQKMERESRAPMYFAWHEKCYLGAAHGYVGILYTLLKVVELFPEGLRQKHVNLIYETLDWLLTFQYPSGNLPSSIPVGSDKLIHWCHGAPGLVYLVLQAHRLNPGVKKYMKSAEKCGEVIWERGLLKKGNSLCHGVAGNGMALLELYRVTGKGIWLERATDFARFVIQRDPRSIGTPPDRPDSLYEGAAGVAFFLGEIAAILTVPKHQSFFPGFSLPQAEFTSESDDS